MKSKETYSNNNWGNRQYVNPWDKNENLNQSQYRLSKPRINQYYDRCSVIPELVPLYFLTKDQLNRIIGNPVPKIRIQTDEHHFKKSVPKEIMGDSTSIASCLEYLQIDYESNWKSLCHNLAK